MKKWLLLCVLLTLLSGAALAQSWTGDILGSHDLRPGGKSPIQGGGSAACLYCHAPHSGVGGKTPLWGQTLSTQNYGVYSSTGMQNVPQQPSLGGTSSLCLSCHDGTVAVGSKVPSGTVAMSGSMSAKDVFGTQLQNSHPFSLKVPLVDAAHLVASLAASGTTADPTNSVKLINRTVECNSCHEPHRQNIDPISWNFLAIDSVNGQLCLACHTSSARTVNTKSNRLAQWSTSVHATSQNPVNSSAGLGAYSRVAQFACESCHQQHQANGGAGLLRAAVPPVVGVDAFTQSCITCHNGSTNLQNPIRNVYGEFSKATAHPLPTGGNTHDTNEKVVLDNPSNRHSTCADCHNPHSALEVTSFGAGPAIRASQTGAVGVTVDGTTVVNPAVNQYEVCLRCHGTSPGKQTVGYLPLWAVSAGDRLNVIPQLTSTTSSHPVLHAAIGGSQPSLRGFILNLDGLTNSTRSLTGAGIQILCTDCHNADDNRELGGGGPNGPHGSQYAHVFERRYEFSQVDPVAGPGTLIQNTFPSPSLNSGGAAFSPGPYALCGKCHDLSLLMTGSFPLPGGKFGHEVHVNGKGVSCSVCHTGHGLGALSGNITGERLVNFDLNVVAPNGGTISYSQGPPITCTLTCHAKTH